jgi:DNA-directed RNA polymerase subunit RPC12/RpoP
MPLYAYLCPACGLEQDSLERADRLRCSCGATARRSFRFRTQPSSFTGHYNVAAGKYVSSEGELRSSFARASEEQSRLTGSTVDIQPIDYRDKDQCGITDADVDRLKEEKARAAV